MTFTEKIGRKQKSILGSMDEISTCLGLKLATSQVATSLLGVSLETELAILTGLAKELTCCSLTTVDPDSWSRRSWTPELATVNVAGLAAVIVWNVVTPNDIHELSVALGHMCGGDGSAKCRIAYNLCGQMSF